MLCFVCLRPVSCAHCCLCLWIVYSNYFRDTCMGTRHRTKTNKTQHIKQKRWGARDRTITRGLTCSQRGSNYCRQSRDTGNNGHKTQDEEKQNTTYKTKKIRSTRPYNNPMVNVLYSNYFIFVSTLTLGLLYGLVLLIFFVLYVVFCLSSSCVLCPLLPMSLDCLQ
jgi:hypothetical protein